VTGVLPITLEDSRKTAQALLQSGKEYICIMKLHGNVSEKKVSKVLKKFEGIIYQRPPVRSSVKRRLRTRRIYYAKLLEMEGRHVLFTVGCQAGTYIRKLCFDIGEILGCGAHMQELRRTRAGPFLEDISLVKLHYVAYWFDEWQREKNDALLRRFIQPMEHALTFIPKIYIRDSAVDAVCHGANLTAPGVVSLETGIQNGSNVAIFTLKEEAVAFATATVSTKEILTMKHGIVSRPTRVLMPRRTYPKCWKSG
jgi:H/ACA ribonucleoprotein complex subunit 4